MSRKNILVIGGSAGIGKSLCHILSDSNLYNVYSTYNNNEPQNLENVNYFKFNVLTNELNLENLPEVLDGFVYCPGSINLKPFERFKKEDFQSDLELNVLKGIEILQKIIPKLKKSEKGSVVFYSTVAVKLGLPFHAQVSVSKGAIEGLIKALSAEYAPKIRFNAIAPSLTETNLSNSLLNTEQKIEANSQKHPLKRIGKPEDIAHVTEFLLSEKSSWVTGQILGIDGGFSSIK